jgi:[protein-PII] uridylyltransferase
VQGPSPPATLRDVDAPALVQRPPDLPRLSAAWERLRQDQELKGRQWSRTATDLTDAWLADVFDRAVLGERAEGADVGPKRSGPFGGRRGRRPGPDAPSDGLALVAVGSLGRGDLAPGSDLDLILVHSGRAEIAAVADRIWYPVWDDPMPLDHSVRTLAQVEQAAESDLRVALGLLDARPVAGDQALAAKLVALGHRLWDKRVGRWLPRAMAARADAQRADGDVAFLLEPDLQESRGGLRDVQLLSLMAAVTPVVAAVVADERLVAAGDLLHAVRVELQRDNGRRTERLMLEDQDRVASALGLAGREDLAHQVAGAGRTVAWLVEDASRRVKSWLAGPPGRAGSADRALGPGLVRRDNEVAVPITFAVAEDPTLALRAATASAELGLPLSRATMERLAAEAPSPPTPWSEELRRSFSRLISIGPGSIHAIETLDHLGLWEKYLPEWARVRNRPQFNPYHRWTVDRHLLETAAGAAERMFDVGRPDLLVLGALLHDIGKGTGDDHSESGAAIVSTLSARLGLPGADAHVLHRLVHHHLLLPDVATRRDLDDPATVSSVAEKVQDLTTLELLAALATADGLATGTAAWTPWKARLVEDLVQRVSALLEGRPVPTGAPFPSPEQRRLLTAGRLQVLLDAHHLTVVARDRPGLFSDVTGALAMHDIGVLEARAYSEDRQVLDVFVLDLPEHADPRWDRVVADIEGAVEKRFNVSEALARRPPPRRRPRSSSLAATAARVIVDNDAATRATVIEVRAPDSPGLLHRVSAAIAGLDLDIISARVATLGNAAVDTFYVHADGGKLPRAVDAHQVQRALQSAVERAEPASKS